jgi:hypothetical protein
MVTHSAQQMRAVEMGPRKWQLGERCRNRSLESGLRSASTSKGTGIQALVGMWFLTEL